MEPTSEPPPARVWRDWVLVGLISSATVLEVILRNDVVWRPVALVFGIVVAVTMLFRRTHPLASVAVAFGGLIVLDLAAVVAVGQPFTAYAAAAVVVLVYALFRWGNSQQAAIGCGFVMVEIIVVAATDFTGLTDLGGGILVLLFPAALGLTVRYRRLVSAQRYDQVRSSERDQLARELHDTVAHHVSAIAIQAQAGRFLANSDNLHGAAEALDVIEKEASRALAEMRSVVRSLRGDEEADVGVAPRGVADIAALASEAGAHGIRVEIEQRGALDSLNAPVQGALFRVAQESVTNAQRHARKVRLVQVVVDGTDGDVRLRVSDDGEQVSAAPGSLGYGLVGMSERVALLGGTLRAGPGPERGWQVEATIPREGRAS